MNPFDQARLGITRRHFFGRASTKLGTDGTFPGSLPETFRLSPGSPDWRELAAYASVASLLLNMDEMETKQ